MRCPKLIMAMVALSTIASSCAGGVEIVPLENIMDDLARSSSLQGEPLLKYPLQQAWRDEPEADLQPGLAQIYAGKAGFVVLAVLRDNHISNSAEGFNQHTWTTGDVFEFFIQTAADRYYEIHVTPENRNLFLRWSPALFEAVRNKKSSFNSALIDDPKFARSRTVIDEEHGYWAVYLNVPYEHLSIGSLREIPELPKVAFARYDTTPGRDKPVLSATPDFSKVNFHDIAAWHPLILPN